MRAPAKRYLREFAESGGTHPFPEATERDAVEWLIVEHRRRPPNEHYRPLTWFGRLL